MRNFICLSEKDSFIFPKVFLSLHVLTDSSSYNKLPVIVEPSNFILMYTMALSWEICEINVKDMYEWVGKMF